MELLSGPLVDRLVEPEWANTERGISQEVITKELCKNAYHN